MRALLLLTALALPVADEAPPEPESLIVVVPTAQFKALLQENIDLRKAVLDANDERDQAQSETRACWVERST